LVRLASLADLVEGFFVWSGCGVIALAGAVWLLSGCVDLFFRSYNLVAALCGSGYCLVFPGAARSLSDCCMSRQAQPSQLRVVCYSQFAFSAKAMSFFAFQRNARLRSLCCWPWAHVLPMLASSLQAVRCDARCAGPRLDLPGLSLSLIELA
jgi:hypothetical protein